LNADGTTTESSNDHPQQQQIIVIETAAREAAADAIAAAATAVDYHNSQATQIHDDEPLTSYQAAMQAAVSGCSIASKQTSLTTGAPACYSILGQEILTRPIEKSIVLLGSSTGSIADSGSHFNTLKLSDRTGDSSKSTVVPTTVNSTAFVNSRFQKEMATCQFCGRSMLKKNIPTHIRRAHTPKEELVCLNEEQNIFTFQHLKPGQRRKRSARAYDYSLMTATVSIEEDPTDGIELKFITEGEEILSSDLVQLADRIKYGISQISTLTLTKLIDILSKIELSTEDEVASNAKTIRNMICFYLGSGEEFKYKLRQVSDDIVDKKKQVNNLRADLKEIMTRKAQLERRIQPLICELQRLEDQHGDLIESIMQMNGLMYYEIIESGDAENGS
jgi:hypothetical protein